MPPLRLGTRKSALAQAQARWVAEQLHRHHPDLTIELVFITTTGDVDLWSGPNLHHVRDWGLTPISNLKALFTKEIEDALLEKRIDLAVHSLKDMIAELPKGLIIGAIPLREDPRDVWISKQRIPFKDLPRGAKIATGAVRRQAQIKHHRPDLEMVPIRGNVDTRLRKLQENDWDGLILALAGLKRLGREREATEILPVNVLLPAVGQGCLALEVREDDENMRRRIKSLDHPPSHQAALAERAFLKAMGGNCQTPLAAYAQLVQGPKSKVKSHYKDLGPRTLDFGLTLTGFVAHSSGTPFHQAIEEGPAEQAETLGHRLAEKLLAAGGKTILTTL